MNTPIWDDQPWPGLPALEHDLETDVCVVGLGGSGLACVHELLDLGVRVVGLEAGMVAGGAAGRNGGFLIAGMAKAYHETVALHGRERALAMYALTLEQLGNMIQETPNAIRRTGSLRVAHDAEELEDCYLQLEAMQADGLEAEAYSGPEGEGLLFPQDAALQPLRRCRTLALQALKRGAQLFEHSKVLEVQPGLVRTERGSIRANTVIVTVDGKLEVIFPELEGRVRTARLQMLATAPTDEVRLQRPVYARWGYEYWQQLENGSIALGGFRDHALKEEWTLENTPTERIQSLLESFLRERIGVHAPITHRWAASVAYTENGPPILEEVQPGVWAVGAYSGTGNLVGALCGRAAAQLAVKGHSSINDVLF